jgi:hypothetical protein
MTSRKVSPGKGIVEQAAILHAKARFCDSREREMGRSCLQEGGISITSLPHYEINNYISKKKRQKVLARVLSWK